MTDIVKQLRHVGNDLNNAFPITGCRVLTIMQAADEIERLRQQVQHANDHADAAIKDMELMRKALEFYADVSKYPAPLTGGLGDLYFDCGTIARAALEESK